MEIDRPIVIALIFFAVLLLTFFLVVPEYKSLRQLEASLAQGKAEYAAQFDYFAEITKDYYIIQNRKDDIQKIDDALPENPDLGQLVYYFQKKAKDSGLIFKNLFLSQSSANSENGVKDLTFSLNLFGDYASLGQFIASTENSAKIFDVTNIYFGSAGASSSSSSQSQASKMFDFNLEIKTHSY